MRWAQGMRLAAGSAAVTIALVGLALPGTAAEPTALAMGAQGSVVAAEADPTPRPRPRPIRRPRRTRRPRPIRRPRRTRHRRPIRPRRRRPPPPRRAAALFQPRPPNRRLPRRTRLRRRLRCARGVDESRNEPTDYHAPLTGAFLASQIAEANRISAALAVHTSRVAVATREMDLLAEKSNALLESLAAAREVEHAATLEATRARAELGGARGPSRSRAGGTARVGLPGVLRWGRRVRHRVHDRGDGRRRPRTSATPSATCPTSPSSAPGPLQDVRVLTAEQVRLSAVRDDEAAQARGGHAQDRGGQLGARQGRLGAARPGRRAARAPDRRGREGRTSGRASSSVPARRRPSAPPSDCATR